ncbi:C3H1-type domain-containing protein [Plasmodiophora brassicae]
MLCVTDDDYSEDDAEVHVGAYVAPRPHIQAQLTRLGREIERMLACEPGQTLNLCKLPEKYMAYYSRPIDKLGYSRLRDCVCALAEPLTTRNVRPNGLAVLLMGEYVPSCTHYQKGTCRADPCRFVHECATCGMGDHAAFECGTKAPPKLKSYEHCCLRSKCVGDRHNPDVTVDDVHETLLADVGRPPKRLSLDEILVHRDRCQEPPMFLSASLPCVASSPSASAVASYRLPDDDTDRTIAVFYAHLLVSMRDRHDDNLPSTREDFAFEWATYLATHREQRKSVVARVEFSDPSALVYLTKEMGVVLVNDDALVWDIARVDNVIKGAGVAPALRRQWNQASNWGEAPVIVPIDEETSWGAQLRNPAQTDATGCRPAPTAAPGARRVSAPELAAPSGTSRPGTSTSAAGYTPNGHGTASSTARGRHSPLNQRTWDDAPRAPCQPSSAIASHDAIADATLRPSWSASPGARPPSHASVPSSSHDSSASVGTASSNNMTQWGEPSKESSWGNPDPQTVNAPPAYAASRPERLWTDQRVDKPVPTHVERVASKTTSVANADGNAFCASTRANSLPGGLSNSNNAQAMPGKPQASEAGASAASRSTVHSLPPSVHSAVSNKPSALSPSAPSFMPDVSSVAPVRSSTSLSPMASSFAPGAPLSASSTSMPPIRKPPASAQPVPNSTIGLVDDSDRFLKDLLFSAVLGVETTSASEVDMFIQECLRLRAAGVPQVLAGMRSLWLVSRLNATDADGEGLFCQLPVSASTCDPLWTPIRGDAGELVDASALEPETSHAGVGAAGNNVDTSSKASGFRAAQSESAAPPGETIASVTKPAVPPATVAEFLSRASLGSWCAKFDDEEIALDLIPELSDDDLLLLGMGETDRRKFRNAVLLL